jgi:hypothetical protein
MFFWSLDVIVSFFTGYQSELGSFELQFDKVATDYLKHRFPFDIFVVAMDWIMFASTKSNFAVLLRIGKSFRLARIMRLFRMVRVARMKGIMQDVSHSALTGPVAFAFFNIVKLVFMVMLINHFFACGWYGIGKNSGHPNWVSDLDAIDATMFIRYLASYQWSLAQFTPSPTSHRPRNVPERVYAIGILFIGLVMYSAMLGHVTTIITHARIDALNKMVANAKLRNFLEENSISDELAHGIIWFCKDKYASAKKKLAEADVSLIEHLPRHLREELHYEVYAPIVGTHHFFSAVDSHHRITIVAICHTAALANSLGKGEEPIFFGKPGTGMLFPIDGQLHYKAGPETEHLVSDQTTDVGLGAWTTEAPLWIKWEHCGLVSVQDFCNVVELDSYGFRKVLVRTTSVLQAFCHYAEMFLMAVREASTGGEDVDDLWGTPCGKKSDILQSIAEIEIMLKEHAKLSKQHLSENGAGHLGK